MNLKSIGTIKLLLLPSLGLLWLGTLATMTEINQRTQGAPTYSPWEFAWTIPIMLAGMAMTVWCWLRLENCEEAEPTREMKHYQLAHTRLFTVAGCGYLEKDLLKHTNMALRINEVTCPACIMDVWEGVITVNKLAPEPIEIENLIASKVSPTANPTGNQTATPADHRVSMPGAL